MVRQQWEDEEEANHDILQQHDAEVSQRLVGIESDSLTGDMALLPLSFGGLGLRSPVRTSPAAHWASWADCLHPSEDPGVDRLIITRL